MLVYFASPDLQHKTGKVIDTFTCSGVVYYEIYCEDTKQYYVVKIESVTFIEDD